MTHEAVNNRYQIDEDLSALNQGRQVSLAEVLWAEHERRVKEQEVFPEAGQVIPDSYLRAARVGGAVAVAALPAAAAIEFSAPQAVYAEAGEDTLTGFINNLHALLGTSHIEGLEQQQNETGQLIAQAYKDKGYAIDNERSAQIAEATRASVNTGTTKALYDLVRSNPEATAKQAPTTIDVINEVSQNPQFMRIDVSQWTPSQRSTLPAGTIKVYKPDTPDKKPSIYVSLPPKDNDLTPYSVGNNKIVESATVETVLGLPDEVYVPVKAQEELVQQTQTQSKHEEAQKTNPEVPALSAIAKSVDNAVQTARQSAENALKPIADVIKENPPAIVRVILPDTKEVGPTPSPIGRETAAASPLQPGNNQVSEADKQQNNQPQSRQEVTRDGTQQAKADSSSLSHDPVEPEEVVRVIPQVRTVIQKVPVAEQQDMQPIVPAIVRVDRTPTPIENAPVAETPPVGDTTNPAPTPTSEPAGTPVIPQLAQVGADNNEQPVQQVNPVTDNQPEGLGSGEPSNQRSFSPKTNIRKIDSPDPSDSLAKVSPTVPSVSETEQNLTPPPSATPETTPATDPESELSGQETPAGSQPSPISTATVPNAAPRTILESVGTATPDAMASVVQTPKATATAIPTTPPTATTAATSTPKPRPTNTPTPKSSPTARPAGEPREAVKPKEYDEAKVIEYFKTKYLDQLSAKASKTFPSDGYKREFIKELIKLAKDLKTNSAIPDVVDAFILDMNLESGVYAGSINSYGCVGLFNACPNVLPAYVKAYNKAHGTNITYSDYKAGFAAGKKTPDAYPKTDFVNLDPITQFKVFGRPYLLHWLEGVENITHMDVVVAVFGPYQNIGKGKDNVIYKNDPNDPSDSYDANVPADTNRDGKIKNGEVYQLAVNAAKRFIARMPRPW